MPKKPYSIMFTTVAELEEDTYWRFYQTKKRYCLYTRETNTWKIFLLYKTGKAMPLVGPHWSSVRSCRLQMFFKKTFLKVSPISQIKNCAGVSFHCKIGDIFENTLFSQNTSGGCFWSVFCSNPEASRTL